ncbi:MAG: hypothetical protein CUN55_02295 [Phototrophicales bacterium]|nr:MAG: hypothetical protein CUN55_02295 [Phototrophicales bacterium]
MERIVNLVKQGLVIYGAVETALVRYYHVLLGIALGMLIGILFVPVYFRPNAVPAQLDDTYREQWIKDTANGYQYILDFANQLEDQEVAAALRTRAEEEVKRKLTDVGATPDDITALIQNNEENTYLVDSLNSILPFAEQVENAALEQKEQYSKGPPGAISRALTTLGIFILFAILGLIVTIVFKLWDIPFLKQIRNLINPKEEDPSLKAARERKKERERAAALRTTFDTPPVAQFTTSYLKGDNYYDDSFAIELGSPDDPKRPFLGECGAGISKAFKATATSDKQVVAIEAFLFDKVDGATITHVIMSPAAYQDEALRAELAPRGELHAARVGDSFVLETQTLQAQVTILDLEYDNDAEKPEYVFTKLTLELAVWQKEGAEVPDAGDDDFVMPKPIIDIPLDDEPVSPPPARAEVQPLTPADIPQQQRPAPPPPPPQQPMAPPQQPFAPPPTQQTTQGMPPQVGDMTQPRQPFPAQPPQPPQRQPFPTQQPPQQPAASPPQMPPQQRPPAPPPTQGQRPPIPPSQGGRPPIPQQGGQRPPVPPPTQGQRPPIPQQGQGNYPPMPPRRRVEDDSPFGDTGDFNL